MKEAYLSEPEIDPDEEDWEGDQESEFGDDENLVQGFAGGEGEDHDHRGNLEGLYVSLVNGPDAMAGMLASLWREELGLGPEDQIDLTQAEQEPADLEPTFDTFGFGASLLTMDATDAVRNLVGAGRPAARLVAFEIQAALERYRDFVLGEELRVFSGGRDVFDGQRRELFINAISESRVQVEGRSGRRRLGFPVPGTHAAIEDEIEL